MDNDDADGADVASVSGVSLQSLLRRRRERTARDVDAARRAALKPPQRPNGGGHDGDDRISDGGHDDLDDEERSATAQVGVPTRRVRDDGWLPRLGALIAAAVRCASQHACALRDRTVACWRWYGALARSAARTTMPRSARCASWTT